MSQRPGPNRIGWSPWTRAFLALVVLAAIGPRVSQAGAMLQLDTDFTPASGDAQVIAQGVVELPEEELVWRTVRHSANPETTAEFVTWPLGFVISTTSPLLLTDQDTGEQVRLGPGEGAFVRDGTIQRRASLGDATTSYLALELVPAVAADETVTGTVLQKGPAFVPASGPRDLDLVRANLTGDEVVVLPDTGENNVLLVTEGPLVAGPPGGEGGTLLAGEALMFAEEMEVSLREAGEDRAGAGNAQGVFVAAIIGSSVPAVSTSEETGDGSIARPTGPVARASTGSVSIEVFNCPSGMDPENVVEAECIAATGNFDVILSSAGPRMTLTLADSVAEGNIFIWEPLPYGEYRLAEVVLPPDFETYVMTADRPIDGGPEVGYTLTLDEAAPDALLKIYNVRAS